jgi:cyclohexanecarboxylate-CoA ligase
MLHPLSRGMTAVFQDVWHPGGFLDLIEVEGVTWTIGATPFVVDAVEEQIRSPRSFSSLRTFVCAGAPISPALAPRAASELGAQLLAQWGTSECGGVTVHHPSDDVETVCSSDGRPIGFMALKIVDDAGNPVPLGTEGRLIVRGPSVFVGYLGRGDLYDDVVDPDGWFDTGDLGIEHSDGTVRITGRAKDIIIRGGENIPVVEIENLLLTHPGIREVAVIGLPDERLGERGCAVIVPRDEAPGLPELLKYLDEHGTAKQYWPEHLVVVDEMPRTPSGKIQKFRLRELATENPDQ